MNELETKTVVVRLENEKFAISINHVLSIEKMLPLTKVPKYPDYVKGVVHLDHSNRSVKIIKLDGRMLILLETENLFKTNEKIESII